MIDEIVVVRQSDGSGGRFENEIPSSSDSLPPSPAGTFPPPMTFLAATALGAFAFAVAVAGAFAFAEALELLWAAGSVFLDLDFAVAFMMVFAMTFPFFSFPLDLVLCILSRSMAFSSSEVPSV